MNIAVNLYGGGVCCRPDTTMDRENRDFYSPDFSGGLMYSPVLFARISKAGRCVAEKFAGRYYDSVGYGILMYPAALMDDIAWASCIDRTSRLPFPMYNRITLGQEDNFFRLFRDGEEIYCTNGGSESMIEKAIARITGYMSLRTGDLIAAELEKPSVLVAEAAARTEVRATFCENELFRFSIV